MSGPMTGLADWLPVLGGIAAAAAAGWRWLQRPARRTRLLMPILERRYARRADEWDRYDNRFLEDAGSLPKRLRLSDLYVQLSFRPLPGDSGDQPDAFQELRRHARTNICVLGEPGSGKSTFLRAYATRAAGGRVVFLVSLREFAAGVDPMAPVSDLDEGNRLARFLLNELCRAGIRATDARPFLARVLRQDRVDVLLDGLDEVPTDRIGVLRKIIGSFSTDGRQELPTKQARLVVTCRTDNYRMIGALWTDDLDMRVYELDGLRDREMTRYVHLLRDAFHDPVDGPDRYLRAVWGSGTLPLHRIPLVLAMSVGVFAGKSQYQIPDAVNDLYDRMIGHLLERHAFPQEPVSPLQFRNSHDKRRVLQRLAARNATADGRDDRFGTAFGVFGRAALAAVTREMTGELDERHRLEGRTEEFVDEIVTHAGLVGASGSGTLQFSHRSIQEYLVAAEFRQRGDAGRDVLLARAPDPAWGFVIQLYSAMVTNQGEVNDLLTRLLAVDPPLAGGCLAWARPDDATARTVLHSLAEDLRHRLDDAPGTDGRAPEPGGRDLVGQQESVRLVEAVLAAVRSPRSSVSDIAMSYAERALRAVIAHNGASTLLGTDTDALVKVVDALSYADLAHSGRLIPVVVETLPDDVRLVGPLWRCLRSVEDRFDPAAPPAGAPALRQLASRLLTIVRRREGLDLLQAQPRAADPPFRALRRSVYPFPGGHPLDSNLVTLLCWARLLDAAPSPLNRFFEAQRDEARPQAFGRVEADRGHDTRGRPFWLARVVSGGAMLVALAVAGSLTATDPAVVGRVLRPPLLDGVAVLLAAVTAGFLALVVRSRRWRPELTVTVLLRPGAAPRQRISGNAVAECCARLLPAPLAQAAFVLSPLGYALALAPLAGVSTPLFLAVTGLAQLVLVWVPFLAVFDRGDLGRSRNPYIDTYDDEASRAWLVPEEAP